VAVLPFKLKDWFVVYKEREKVRHGLQNRADTALCSMHSDCLCKWMRRVEFFWKRAREDGEEQWDCT
jgi:hypothetical protein